MEKTRLQTQIEAIEEQFNKLESSLKQQKKQLIDSVWKSNLESGALKQDLEQ